MASIPPHIGEMLKEKASFTLYCVLRTSYSKHLNKKSHWGAQIMKGMLRTDT